MQSGPACAPQEVQSVVVHAVVAPEAAQHVIEATLEFRMAKACPAGGEESVARGGGFRWSEVFVGHDAAVGVGNTAAETQLVFAGGDDDGKVAAEFEHRDPYEDGFAEFEWNDGNNIYQKGSKCE